MCHYKKNNILRTENIQDFVSGTTHTEDFLY